MQRPPSPVASTGSTPSGTAGAKPRRLGDKLSGVMQKSKRKVQAIGGVATPGGYQQENWQWAVAQIEQQIDGARYPRAPGAALASEPPQREHLLSGSPPRLDAHKLTQAQTEALVQAGGHAAQPRALQPQAATVSPTATHVTYPRVSPQPPTPQQQPPPQPPPQQQQQQQQDLPLSQYDCSPSPSPSYPTTHPTGQPTAYPTSPSHASTYASSYAPAQVVLQQRSPPPPPPPPLSATPQPSAMPLPSQLWAHPPPSQHQHRQAAPLHVPTPQYWPRAEAAAEPPSPPPAGWREICASDGRTHRRLLNSYLDTHMYAVICARGPARRVVQWPLPGLLLLQWVPLAPDALCKWGGEACRGGVP